MPMESVTFTHNVNVFKVIRVAAAVSRLVQLVLVLRILLTELIRHMKLWSVVVKEHVTLTLACVSVTRDGEVHDVLDESVPATVMIEVLV